MTKVKVASAAGLAAELRGHGTGCVLRVVKLKFHARKPRLWVGYQAEKITPPDGRAGRTINLKRFTQPLRAAPVTQGQAELEE